ncbi:MAG: sulfite exporter TauE/SafE family protein [Candidatus Nanopelagicales bacterium]
MDLGAGQLLLLAGVGVLAGVINGVVGSGTLLTFPVLVALGIPPVVANGTNTTGLFPGSFSATWPSRDELLPRRRRLWPLALVSFVFALCGALLVIVLPPTVFASVVPWLIGGAVVLVAVQPWVVRRLAERDAGRETPEGPPSPGLLAAIAGTGTYGGYFGAAQGVVLLGVLGVLDDTDPRRANGVKNLLAFCANTAAAIVFVSTGRVVWPAALALMVGAMVGGYVGGHGARRLPAVVFRVLIIVVGLLALVSLIVRH